MRNLILLTWLALSACNPLEKKLVNDIPSIDSLITAQTSGLKDYTLVKRVSVDDSIFRVVTVRSPINWSKELEPFREISQINRPIYQRAYAQSLTRDRQSNLMIKTWLAKTTLPFHEIKLYYLPNENLLKRVEAHFTVRDFYLTVTKKLVLDFSLLGEVNRLESYHISIVQKHFWAEPEYFYVDGLIKPQNHLKNAKNQ